MKLCLWRGFQSLKADPTLTYTQLFGNLLMAIVIGSVFLNIKPSTEDFYSRGSLLFFAVLINAFASVLEVERPPFMLVAMVFPSLDIN